jgi:hypothetical protein
MQFDVNYSWSHTLGAQPDNQWTGNTSQFTLRNQRLSYGPTLFDIRHVIHIMGVYDLPFGTGKHFLNGNKYLDKVVGGWSVGTILTYQSGAPVLIGGGYRTFNSTADGGVLFNGLTAGQLQNSVGVYHVPGASYADGINPTYLVGATGGGANSQYLTPNSVAGTFGMHSWIYGPHFFNDDIAITKTIPIHENIRFTFQGEFLNAFNHPNWAISNGNIRSSGFGLANVINTVSAGNPNGVGARQIELRANIEF